MRSQEHTYEPLLEKSPSYSNFLSFSWKKVAAGALAIGCIFALVNFNNVATEELAVGGGRVTCARFCEKFFVIDDSVAKGIDIPQGKCVAEDCKPPANCDTVCDYTGSQEVQDNHKVPEGSPDPPPQCTAEMCGCKVEAKQKLIFALLKVEEDPKDKEKLVLTMNKKSGEKSDVEVKLTVAKTVKFADVYAAVEKDFQVLNAILKWGKTSIEETSEILPSSLVGKDPSAADGQAPADPAPAPADGAVAPVVAPVPGQADNAVKADSPPAPVPDAVVPAGSEGQVSPAGNGAVPAAADGQANSPKAEVKPAQAEIPAELSSKLNLKEGSA